jgi:DNA-binding response OmpR family regulator
MGRILLLEDDPSVAEALGYLFDALGHEVRITATVREARQLVVEHPPDLVVSDEGLADGLGSEFLTWVAARSGVARLLLTGGRFQEIGPLPPGTVVRQKPWDLADAESTLDGILGARDAPR